MARDPLYLAGLILIGLLVAYFTAWVMLCAWLMIGQTTPMLFEADLSAMMRSASPLDWVTGAVLYGAALLTLVLYIKRLRITGLALLLTSLLHMRFWVGFLLTPNGTHFDGAPGFIVLMVEGVVGMIIVLLWSNGRLK